MSKLTPIGIYCPTCKAIYSLDETACPSCGRCAPVQGSNKPEPLVVLEINGKKGCVGLNDHRIYLAPEYDDVRIYSYSVICVSKNGKYGFVKDGQISEFPYEDMADFQYGLCPVKRDGKVGAVNVHGEEVIPCSYEYIFIDDRDALVCKSGETIRLDMHGKTAVGDNYEYNKIVPTVSGIAVVLDSKDHPNYNVKVIDSLGRDSRLSDLDILGVDNGCIFYSNPNCHFTGMLKDYYIIQFRNGKLSKKCYCVGCFLDGLAYFESCFDENDFEGDGESKKTIGFYDEYGNIIIEDTFERATQFKNGRAAVLKNGEYYYIDKTGQRLQDKCASFEDETMYELWAPEWCFDSEEPDEPKIASETIERIKQYIEPLLPNWLEFNLDYMDCVGRFYRYFVDRSIRGEDYILFNSSGDYIGDFSSLYYEPGIGQIVATKSDGLYIYTIDEDGSSKLEESENVSSNLLLPYKFQMFLEFAAGFLICVDNTYSLISRSGEILIGPSPEQIDFYNDLFYQDFGDYVNCYNIFGQKIDIVEDCPISMESLQKNTGRVFAMNVRVFWMEDFEDEDTGDIIKIERGYSILDRGEEINDSSIKTILEKMPNIGKIWLERIVI